jgi:hypothetical protein
MNFGLLVDQPAASAYVEQRKCYVYGKKQVKQWGRGVAWFSIPE